MTLPNFNELTSRIEQPEPFPGKRLILMGLLIAVVSCGSQAASENSGIGGTSEIAMPKTTSIQEVQKTADRNSIVTIKGTVGDRVPILEGTVYEIQDSTGKIWVLTKKQPPELGQEVIITGSLRFKSIPLNGQEQGSVYLEEE